MNGAVERDACGEVPQPPAAARLVSGTPAGWHAHVRPGRIPLPLELLVADQGLAVFGGCVSFATIICSDSAGWLEFIAPELYFFERCIAY